MGGLVSSPQSGRGRLNLNREWKFLPGDAAGAHELKFEDANWARVGLPHTFDLPYFRAADFYVGVGWYRKRIDIPVGWGTKRLFLDFEGVFQVADVFVNGTLVGGHEGGYTGFCIEITEAVRAGANLLAVKVDNSWNPRLVPRAGEHIFSGGIYRDVYLLVKEPLHITWHGVCVTTPSVSRESATVMVTTEVSNRSGQASRFRLATRVCDPRGRVVASSDTSHEIGARSTVEIEQALPAIAGVELWHPNHPVLYRVFVELHKDGLVDEFESGIGFRWFQWTSDRGFFLNGEHLYLRGVNAHQDQAGWGIATTHGACFRDVKLIKEAGFNFVRGAHYPHHPAFADACDRLGVIFWSEACFWGKGGFGPEGYWNASAYPIDAVDREPFEESCERMLAEMIRINRNHPSIVIWSMTNEAFFTYDVERVRSLIARMVKLSHELDPTRPAAVGGAQRGQVDKLGDVAGYNGDGARLFMDPGIANMVSEYGAISKPVDAYEPFFGELQSERFAWRGGEAIWCGFDYGSIAGRQGLKGIVQHNRIPKRSWYWYRNELRGIAPPAWPVPGIPAKLEMTADKSTIEGTDAIDDCQIVVRVLDAGGNRVSNSPAVTLTIESGPGEFPTGRCITFDAESDIAIAEGEAGIAFRSYHGGESRIRATSPGLEDAWIIVNTEGEPRWVEGETMPVTAQPYKRAEPSQASIEAMKNAVNVARDRPSAASSEAEGHFARFANDADAQTWWEAREAGIPAWFRIDLEGFYQLSSCRLSFNAAGNYRYRVELSMDGAQWTLAIDRTRTERVDVVRNDIFDPGAVARYVRITFTAIPPGARASLREAELYGVLSNR
jgi:beta-galactosidase